MEDEIKKLKDNNHDLQKKSEKKTKKKKDQSKETSSRAEIAEKTKKRKREEPKDRLKKKKNKVKEQIVENQADSNRNEEEEKRCSTPTQHEHDLDELGVIEQEAVIEDLDRDMRETFDINHIEDIEDVDEDVVVGSNHTIEELEEDINKLFGVQPYNTLPDIDFNLTDDEADLDFDQVERVDKNLLEEIESTKKEDDLIQKGQEDQVLSDISNQVAIPSSYYHKLLPHQKTGLKFLWENVKNDQGCILADYMGLGKTLQAVSFVHLYLKLYKKHTVLVIVPNSVVRHWEREFHKMNEWVGSEALAIKPHVLVSTLTKDERLELLRTWSKAGGPLITNYDLFRSLALSGIAELSDILTQPEVVILDEGHKIKNMSARINKLLDPTSSGRSTFFKTIYAKPIIKGQGSTDILQRRVARRRAWLLHQKVSTLVLRRDGLLLGDTLPTKTEYIIHVRLSNVQFKLYQALLQGFQDLSNQFKSNLFWSYDVLILLCNHPDILSTYQYKRSKAIKEFQESASQEELQAMSESDAASISLLEKILSDAQKDYYKRGDIQNGGKIAIIMNMIWECKNIGDRLVIFTRSLHTLDFIQNTLDRYNNKCESSGDGHKTIQYSRFDGSTPFDKRQNFIDDFNNIESGRSRLLLVSTLAGGEGINLHSANRVVLVDVNWNPSHDSEACCRVYRYGQKKPVSIYRLVSVDTMEDNVLSRQLRKQVLSSWVIDDGNCNVVNNFLTQESNNLYQTPKYFLPPKDSLDSDPPHGHVDQVAQQDPVIKNFLVNLSKFIHHIGIHSNLLQTDAAATLSEDEKKLAENEEEYDRVYKKRVTDVDVDLVSEKDKNKKKNVVVSASQTIDLKILEEQKQVIEKQNKDNLNLLNRLEQIEEEADSVASTPRTRSNSSCSDISNNRARTSSGGSRSSNFMKMLAKESKRPGDSPTVQNKQHTPRSHHNLETEKKRLLEKNLTGRTNKTADIDLNENRYIDPDEM
ncbi:DNA repair and recombination protein RAD54L2 [Acrasis kona]|uniref:DNA repair and recombination protein RAD54L2 n=1 Tax=Acrasis kona TaxID=1008807 RepID=A0AAW2YHU5_9EUKA